MELQQLQKHWDDWGRQDPVWAILSDHRGRSIEEFFQRGREEVADRLQALREFGIQLPRTGKALDFGCGMGRLSQALCEHFDGGCDGVDIAPSMIELARQHNRHGGDRCRYHLNRDNDLLLFPDRSFTFVYTALVLQHMRPRYAMKYVREFCRLLAPGGVAMFQAPGEQRLVDGHTPRPQDTPPDAPLLNGAYCARITPINLPPIRGAGMQLLLQVRLLSTGDAPWPAATSDDGQLVLANRWFDETSGAPVEALDGRTLLPRDVDPGESVETRLLVTMPQQPGEYVLELDILQDGVGKRFGDVNPSSATRATVRVVPSLVSEAGKPAIQMFGLSKASVVDAITSAGMKLVAVIDNDAAGPNWTSYTYVVQRPVTTKPAATSPPRPQTFPHPICPDPVFVMGAPRSGTTILAWAIAQHAAFWTCEETQVLWDLLSDGMLLKNYRRKLRGGHSWLENHGIPPAEYLGYIGLSVNALFTRFSENKRWVDHGPTHALMADELLDMFPGAKFVNVLRSGHRTVHSMINYPTKGEDWTRNFRAACDTWVRYVDKAAAFEAAHPDRCITVRNEDMTADPERTFRRIFNFLGVAFDESAAKYVRTTRVNSSFAGPADKREPWDQWTPGDRVQFVAVAGDLESRLYPDAAPKMPAEIAAALPANAFVLVVNKGDDALLKLACGRRAAPFPQDESGVYAGHHPADGAEAVAHLESLRKSVGPTHLLLPCTSFWWLEHYPEFKRHLETRCKRVLEHPTCAIFALKN